VKWSDEKKIGGQEEPRVVLPLLSQMGLLHGLITR
jgi:hypothetical protein